MGFTFVGLMKVLAIVVAFLAGVAVTAVACSALNAARNAQRTVQLLSDVHDPVRQCLNDTVQCYDRGETALAERKMRLLQQRWSEYLEGGRPPEQFASELMAIGGTTTRPAP